MRIRDLVLWWGGLAVLCLLLFYYVSDILLPFVVAVISAFFLDPAADKLEKAGLSRMVATAVITVSFFLFGALVLLIIGPLLYDQLASFVQKIPHYVNFVQDSVMPVFNKTLASFSPDTLEQAQSSLGSVSTQVLQVLTGLLKSIWNSGVAVVNLLSLIFITPIVTFYILRDWDVMVAKANSLLPKKHAGTIRDLAGQIHTTLAGYIRGQTNVCLFLAVFYTIGLSLVGLEFALFVGIATGILSFIPYVGSLFGLLTSTLLAFFQFDDWYHVAIVAAIFIVGQVIEGSIVSPKFVGDKVGLHPVWIIFGMLAGGSLFGFVGILIAVPVTAVIGVLLRFAIKQYVKHNNVVSSPAKKKGA